ncbi:hypothetical protein BAC3_01471 [uncultured bacterium]|nr:hypothetical protein BAC3_01471 [uncultured bacterium]
MEETEISSGVVHILPEDLKLSILSNSGVTEIWNSLTPLARNEWICWVISVKKPETRNKHIKRLLSDVQAGKRRPCCWPGCPHRGKAAQMVSGK